MMQCYHRLNDRAGVARQYRQLEQVLRDHLGIEPNEAAKLLYRELGAA
jgi:DNA-binding SARP family transcriptional activator